MDDVIFAFPATISQIKKRLAAIRSKFEESNADPTGASTRLLDQDRVLAFSEMGELESLISRLRPIQRLSSPNRVCLGHLVLLRNDAGKELQLHMCSDVDVKYLQSNLDDSSERLLSISSPLGQKLQNKRVDENVEVGGLMFRVVEISDSDYNK